jgi:phosphate transport system substrate-binding protein
VQNRSVRPRRIGSYRVIASLGRGGMADVFLAARLGPVKFTKLVVIKRLRSDLANQPEATRYRTLLLDEARLAARMHHPNIVQAFEVTEGDGEPYLTMEFLDGQTISQVVRAARRAKTTVPLEMSLRAVADVLTALAYAHDLRDFDGKPMRIVHRDVSPQNVFWTYDGEIKLVDFGVAKFAFGSTKTDAGFIKGKVSYMAPEQARGEPLDRRADLFAVGVMLWELITSQRLFRANTQAATLQKLLFEPIPRLSEIVADVDPALEQICERALARNRDDRYRDATEMRADLEAVLEATSPRREHLAAFVGSLFASQREAMVDMIRTALSRDESEVIEVPPGPDEDSDDAVLDDESATETSVTVPSRPTRKSRPAWTVPPPRAPRARRFIVGGLLAAIAITVGAVVAVATSRGSREQAPAATPPATQGPATVEKPALRLCGSNTIGAEIAPALVEAFLRKKGASAVSRRAGGAEETTIEAAVGDRHLVIELQAHGSATAFEGLLAGSCDIGMASRAANDAEAAKLAQAGMGDPRSPANEHVIALDGIAVIVHPDNPVRGLTRDQLHDVFTGKIADWSGVGGRPGPIAIHARDDRSGTYDTFKHLVLGGDPLASSAKRLAASDALADAVATDPAAIGFIGLAYVRSARALAVGDAGAPSMLPTSFTVTTEDYMLSRRLYFYTTPKPTTPLVAELVAFTLSAQGQSVVRENGFVDLAIALRDATPCGSRCPPRYASATAQAKRVSLDFRFRTGSDELDSRATRDLDRLVQMLREHPSGKLILLGFSDASGDTATNNKLSSARAQTLARELAARGVTPAVVEGFGGALPVASNQTEPGRERNRRVEVWLRE